MCRKRVGLTGEWTYMKATQCSSQWYDYGYTCHSFNRFWLLAFVLPGFDCRCGNLFCGIHRYSDKHNCPYDYKAEAAAKIRKENPVVVADKIQRI